MFKAYVKTEMVIIMAETQRLGNHSTFVDAEFHCVSFLQSAATSRPNIICSTNKDFQGVYIFKKHASSRNLNIICIYIYIYLYDKS